MADTSDLIAMIIDRDTPSDLDGDVVVDWDMTGKPITRRMVNDWAKARAPAQEPGAQQGQSSAREGAERSEDAN